MKNAKIVGSRRISSRSEKVRQGTPKKKYMKLWECNELKV